MQSAILHIYRVQSTKCRRQNEVRSRCEIEIKEGPHRYETRGIALFDKSHLVTVPGWMYVICIDIVLHGWCKYAHLIIIIHEASADIARYLYMKWALAVRRLAAGSWRWLPAFSSAPAGLRRSTRWTDVPSARHTEKASPTGHLNWSESWLWCR